MAGGEVLPNRGPWSLAACSVFFLCAFVYYFAVGNHTYINFGLFIQRSPTLTNGCDYVGFEPPTTGNGLGNHMFYLSGVIYFVWLTGRHPCIWTTVQNGSTILDTVFNVNIPRFDVRTFGCPVDRFRQKGVYLFDPLVQTLINVSHTVSLVVKGAFASWKYVLPVDERVRQQLTFHSDLIQFVADFFRENVPSSWSRSRFVLVGVHVRRGDFLADWANATGFTTADERYLHRAMDYFVERFPRVQFIVASNDIPWCQKHINVSTYNSSNVHVTFSVGHNAGQDLALLASCNHTITSTGTFGWWAAWLANGITLYYDNFPRNGSWLATQFRKRDFYHSDWIGISD